MFMCVVNLKPVNKLDLTWKQSFLIHGIKFRIIARASILFIMFDFHFVSCNYEVKSSLVMDQLKCTGLNLSSVFNTISCLCFMHTLCCVAKMPDLWQETQPKQRLGSPPLAFTLPSFHNSIWAFIHKLH
jgi:hypothetical protein